MVHGPTQSIFALGDTSDSNSAANVLDDDFIDIDAADVDVDSTSLTGTAVTVQGALVELDDLLDTTAATLATTTTTANAAAVAATVTTENAVNLAYRPLYSRVTAEATVTNSETLVPSTLTVTLAAGTYEWEAVLLVTTTAAADIDIKPTGTATITAGSSDTVIVAGFGGDATVAKLPTKLTAWNTETAVVSTGVPSSLPVLLKGTVVCTVAGTLRIDFAQTVATAAEDTKILNGSYLVAQKVA